MLDFCTPGGGTTLLCCTISQGATSRGTLGEDTGLFLGASSCTKLFCSTISKGATLRGTLREDIVLFLGTTAGGVTSLSGMERDLVVDFLSI